MKKIFNNLEKVTQPLSVLNSTFAEESETQDCRRQSKRVRNNTVTDPLPISSSTFAEQSETQDCPRQSKNVRKEPSITFVDVPENVDCRKHAEKTDPLPVLLAMANFAHVLTSERPPVVQCISYASSETFLFMDYAFDLETIPNHNEQCKRATVSVVQNEFHKAEEFTKVIIGKSKN